MSEATAASEATLRVAVSGASGLIGRRVTEALAAGGQQVVRLVRTPDAVGPGAVYWNPATGEFDAGALEGVDAIVHLAGESLAGGRWSAARKALIRSSRVDGTKLLCAGLGRLRRPPSVLIAASAIGYYGDRGEEVLTENSPVGSGFLAELVRDWEAATATAGAAGVRVVNLRTGMVLSGAGGALTRMLTPFRLGLGGKVGGGRQYVSWVALDDLVAIVRHLLLAADVAGPVNAVAPGPVTNAEFARTLGRVLRRPAVCPLPAGMVRLLFGQMGRELLLSSARVLPERLTARGFRFRYARLEETLRAELASGA